MRLYTLQRRDHGDNNHLGRRPSPIRRIRGNNGGNKKGYTDRMGNDELGRAIKDSWHRDLDVSWKDDNITKTKHPEDIRETWTRRCKPSPDALRPWYPNPTKPGWE